MNIPAISSDTFQQLMAAALADFSIVLGRTIMIGQTYKIGEDGEQLVFNHRRQAPVRITGVELMSFDEGGNHTPMWYVMPTDASALRAAVPGAFVWGVSRNEVGDVSVPPYTVADVRGDVPHFRRWSPTELAVLSVRVYSPVIDQ